MATLPSTQLTLVDWANRYGADGKILAFANLLQQNNEILDDAVFIEANQPTSHVTPVVTGLPKAYWRSYNKGIPSSKATTVKVEEAIGNLEAYSTIDKAIAKLNANLANTRANEDTLFIESMNQGMAQNLFYGNPANDPIQPMGLHTRYGTISGAGNAQNIIDAGGVASINTSIYVVVWGENTVHCVFPRGSKAGLQVQDLGEQTVYDDNNNPYQAYRSHFLWENGLVVKNWQYVARICNIDTTRTNNDFAASIIESLVLAISRIPNLGMGRPAIYMNRTCWATLMIQALKKSQNALSVQEGLTQFGTPRTWMNFLGIPIRKVDQILNTEARIV